MKLDEKQKEAVYTNYNNVLVCAPPGSGKTTVIINRIYNLVEYKKVNPGNIIVITFTKSAAENMKDRYLRISGKNNKIPFFGTFHSLFYRILLKYKNKINIIDEKTTYNIIKDVLNLYINSVDLKSVNQVLNDISYFKNSDCDVNNFRSKIDINVFKQCLNTYEKYKYKGNLMDFDDLQFEAKKLFFKDKTVLNKCRSIFKYILVDEFQDSDILQIELLKLISFKNSIFAVGDEDQCIYGFRGSSPEWMMNFDRYFDNGKKLFLDTNYRSTKNIVELSKVLILNNKNRNHKIIKSCRKEYGIIELITFQKVREESNYISSVIKENKYNYKDTAVFYRTNLECTSIVDGFLKYGIKFRFLNERYNFFEHFVCMDIIAYLKLSIDEYDKESFIRIVNRPFRFISRINIEKVRKNYTRESCFDIFTSIKSLSILQVKSMRKLKRKIGKLNKMPLNKAVDFIMFSIGYMEYLKDYCNKKDDDVSIFRYIVEEFKEISKKFYDIEMFLKYIEKFSDSIEKDSYDGVILSTIHGVKGMEFKNVFIVNCNEEIIPHINSIAENIEEERRLFYVGITRAIDNLHLYSVKTLSGKSKKISRFIDEIISYI